MRERHRLVLETLLSIPTAVSIAGGYARGIEDTVDIHFATVEIAVACGMTNPIAPGRATSPARVAPLVGRARPPIAVVGSRAKKFLAPVNGHH